MNEKNKDMSEFDKQQRLKSMLALRENWNAPQRNVDNFQLAEKSVGVWAEARDKIFSLLSKGTIIAIIGRRGNGKTQLGVNAMFAATSCLKSAYYITALRFFMRIKGTYRKDSPVSDENVVDELAAYKLLVIDEMAKRSETMWENQMLCELIDTRHAAKKDTILIGNYTQEGFEQSLDDSIIRRLNDTGGVIVADWPPVSRDVKETP